MRKAVLLLILCCIFAACGGPDPSETIAVPTVPATEPPTEGFPSLPAYVLNVPLPVTIDLNNLDNCTIAVSLEKGDAYYGSGITHIPTMNVTVYAYDLYDMVDIAAMKGGHSILIRGEAVVIEALEWTDSGAVLINGGLDMGGYELHTDDNTVYYETRYSDMKYWQELGDVAMEVSENFVFTDASDLDKGPVTYTFEELISNDSGIDYFFDPQSTTVTIQNGIIVSMERIYTP